MTSRAGNRAFSECQDRAFAESGELTSGECLLLLVPPLSELDGMWILACLVNSSERENRLSQPGWVQAWGFSPVWVRMCRVCIVCVSECSIMGQEEEEGKDTRRGSRGGPDTARNSPGAPACRMPCHTMDTCMAEVSCSYPHSRQLPTEP